MFWQKYEVISVQTPIVFIYLPFATVMFLCRMSAERYYQLNWIFTQNLTIVCIVRQTVYLFAETKIQYSETS